MAKQRPLHIQINMQKLMSAGKPYTLYTMACGHNAYSTSDPQDVEWFDTVVRDALSEITCKKCIKAIAESFPMGNRFGNMMDEIVGKKMVAAVIAAGQDKLGRLSYQRDSFVSDLKSVRERLVYMVEQVDRFIESAQNPEQSNMQRLAVETIELPGRIASNMAVSSLVRDAVVFDEEVKAICERVKREDAEQTAASLAGKVA